MNYEEYRKVVIKTENGSLTDYPKLLHAIMGINGEAGECIDLLKKTIFQGHEFDEKHFLNELGDVCWYTMLLVVELGVDISFIFEQECKIVNINCNEYLKLDHALQYILELNKDCGLAIDIFKYHREDMTPNYTTISILRNIVYNIRMTAYLFGKTIGDIFEINAKKLSKRYPNGFETERSINRSDNL